MRRIPLVGILVLLALLPATGSPRMTGEHVVAMVKRQFAAINDYRADVLLTVRSSRVSIKNMRMTVYYKKPDKVKIEAKDGMGVVPQGSFFGNPIEELARNANPVYVKCEKRKGRTCHVVKLDPKTPNSTPSWLVWVDAQRGLILATRMNSNPSGLTTSWAYSKVAGKHYLPSRIDADMKLPGQQGTESGKATMKFSNYRVNRGISDKVFKDKPARR